MNRRCYWQITTPPYIKKSLPSYHAVSRWNAWFWIPLVVTSGHKNEKRNSIVIRTMMQEKKYTRTEGTIIILSRETELQRSKLMNVCIKSLFFCPPFAAGVESTFGTESYVQAVWRRWSAYSQVATKLSPSRCIHCIVGLADVAMLGQCFPEK